MNYFNTYQRDKRMTKSEEIFWFMDKIDLKDRIYYSTLTIKIYKRHIKLDVIF